MARKAAIVTSPPPSQGMTPAQLETEKDPVYRALTVTFSQNHPDCRRNNM